MRHNRRFYKSVFLTSGTLACLLGTAMIGAAQDFKDLQTPKSPLVLKAQGSFFVGGETADETAVELGSFGPAGHITINQMYVRYMIPMHAEKKPSVVMVHGMTLTGKSWETTPDGRMGWDEYFVRKGHAVYVPDQVSRGRSGFNQAIFNNVRAGATPPAQQPALPRFSDEVCWPNFRFGPKPGVAYPDERFPVAAANELSKQGIPDANASLPTPNPSFKALSDLAGQLEDTVLMGHSQGGTFPLSAALVNTAGIKAMILVEPGTCPAAYTNEQIAKLAAIPILVVFGDHLDTATGIPRLPYWQASFDECKAFIARIKSAGGNAQMLWPPDQGIRGNSHMIMQDKNSFEIADLILSWIDKNVGKDKAKK